MSAGWFGVPLLSVVLCVSTALASVSGAAQAAAKPRVLRDWAEALTLLNAQSVSYRALLARLDRQRAQVSLAREALLPRVSSQGSYGHQFLTQRVDFGTRAFETPVPNALGASATVSWPIGDIRALHTLGTAADELRVAEQDVAAQRRALIAALAANLIGVITSKTSAALARRALEEAQQVSTLTHKRLQYGQVVAADVARAAQDAEHAHGQVLLADEALRVAREDLSVMFGEVRGVDVSEGFALDALPRAVAQTCQVRLDLSARPSVAAALGRVAVARRRVAEEWLSLLPTLSLDTHLDYNSQVTYGPKATWSVQAVARWSIYDGSRYSRLTAARVDERAAQAAAEQARLDAALDAIRSERKVAVAESTLQSLERELTLAEAVDRDLQQAYATGLRTGLELVAGAQARRLAAASVVQARAAVVQAKIVALLAVASCTF